MKRRLGLLIVALLMLGANAAWAVQPGEMLSDPALEARARDLSRELRCMVCQNQSIDDSDAPLARDLRILVRERLQAGDSDNQVLEFLTARYGDFVLLKPPLKRSTLLLWALPAGVLLAGMIALALAITRRRRQAAGAPEDILSESDRARLADMLKDDPGAPGKP